MAELILPGGDQSRTEILKVQAHPVTRVYCNEIGIVCYERKGAEPILLNTIEPKRSRQEALRRCVAILDEVPDENSYLRNIPIAVTGEGLTRNQLKRQTFDAVLKSREIEQRRREAMKASRR